MTLNFNNISSVTNVRYSFSFHENETILEFLWVSWIPNLFQHRPTPDAFCLFTKMRSFSNFSHHDTFKQCFTIDQGPMFFFSSLKWDHFRISLRTTNFNNISSATHVRYCFSFHENEIILESLWTCLSSKCISTLTNVRCYFSLHENEDILAFLSSWGIPTIFRRWPTSDVLFLFTKIRSFSYFPHHE